MSTSTVISPTDCAHQQILKRLEEPEGLRKGERLILQDLCHRLLRPEGLIKCLGDEALLSLLLEEQNTPSHPSFSRINSIIEKLHNLLHQGEEEEEEEGEESPNCLHRLSLHVPLKKALSAYETFRRNLCLRSRKDRKTLLNRRVMLSSDCFKENHICCLSLQNAYTLLSCDLYGFTTKPNRKGTHAVCPLPEDSPRFYVKADLEGTPLKPGLESLTFSFYHSVFGEGCVASRLLCFQDLPQKSAAPESPTHMMFEQFFNKQTARAFFEERGQQNKFNREEEIKKVAQVSLAVEGDCLATFIDQAQKGKKNYNTLESASVTQHMLSHYILGTSDASGDNFIVTPGGKIISIDNDHLFNDPLITVKRTGKEHPGIKSIFYCIQELMGKEIETETRERFLSKSPLEHMMDWFQDFFPHNKRYKKLIDNGFLDSSQSKNLSLPLQLSFKNILSLYNRLKNVHKALDHCRTHEALLTTLHPKIAAYYRGLRHQFPHPNKALQVPCGQAYDEKKRKIPTTLQAFLEKEEEEGEEEEEEEEESGKEFFLQTSVSQGDNTPLPLREVLFQFLQSVDITTDSAFFQSLLSLNQFLEAMDRPGLNFSHLHPSWRKRLRVPDEEGNGCFHDLLKNYSHELFQFVLKLPLTHHLLNHANNKGLTPLDIALTQGNRDAVIALIQKAAFKCYYGHVRKFYEALPSFVDEEEENTQDDDLEQALLQLSYRDPRLRWELTLCHLLPSAKTKLPKLLVKGQIEGSTMGKRHLPSFVYNQLFTNCEEEEEEETQFRKVNIYGRRQVGYVASSGYSLYFKRFPQLPGFDYAVGRLMYEVITHGAPYSDFVMMENVPYLVSQGIEGPTLHDVLFKTEAFKTYCQTHKLSPNDFDLNKLDHSSLMKLLMMTMIVCPEDGLPANYIVERTPQGLLRLICIDNENAFAPDMAREEKGRIAVQVRTILYCLDQMTVPIAEEVKQFFEGLNPEQILTVWLRSLDRVNRAHCQLISQGHFSSLREEEEFYPGIPFREGMISRLYDRFNRLQEVLREETEALTPLNLLEKISPVVAMRYGKAFRMENWGIRERFDAVDGRSFGGNGGGNYCSTTYATALLGAQGLAIKSIAEKVSLVKALQRGTTFGPNQGLEELARIKEYREGTFLESLRRCPTQRMRERLLHKTDFSQLSKQNQLQAFYIISRYSDMREISLRNADQLTTRRLPSILRPLMNITHLRVFGTSIDVSSIPMMSQLPHLILLDVSGCSNLKAFAKWGLFNYGEISFNTLSYLYLNGCTALTDILLFAPHLQRLEAENCPRLRFDKLHLNSPEIRVLNLKNNATLTDKALDQITIGLNHLNHLDLQGCIQVMEAENRGISTTDHLREIMRITQDPSHIFKISNYAPNLFTKDMNRYTRDRIIRDLVLLSPELINIIAQNIPQLLTEDMDGNDRAIIIGALAPLSPEQIMAISQNASQLFIEYMNGNSRAWIIKALAPLSSEKINAIAQNSSLLFTEDMNRYDRAAIIEVLVPLSPETITTFSKSISQNASQIFTKNTYGNAQAWIIKALASLPLKKIIAIFQNASQLFSEGMDQYDRVRIIKSLTHLSPEQILKKK